MGQRKATRLSHLHQSAASKIILQIYRVNQDSDQSDCIGAEPYSSPMNLLVAANFLSAIKSESLVGSKNSDIFEVDACVFLIKMKYIFENCLFTADIHAAKATHIYLKSHA